ATLSWRACAGGVGVCLFAALDLGVVHRRAHSALHLHVRGATALVVASVFVVGWTIYFWTLSTLCACDQLLILDSHLVVIVALALQNLLLLARLARHIDAHHDAPSIVCAGKHGLMLEAALAVALLAAALANVILVATGTSAHGIPLAALLP